MKKSLLLIAVLASGMSLTAHAVDQNVFIDFGATATPGNWNNFTVANDTSGTVTDLIDFDTGADSGINFQMTQPFFTEHAGGESVAMGDFAATAVQDSFYVSDGSRPVGIITFTGLTIGQEYEFNFVSSYNSPTADRYALFTVTGTTTQTTIVNPSSATASVGTIASVFTDDGTVTLQFQKDASNGTTTAFLNSIHIAAVPEPSTYAALLGFAAMGAALVRRRR